MGTLLQLTAPGAATMPDDGNRGPDVSLHGVGSGEQRTRGAADDRPNAIVLSDKTKLVVGWSIAASIVAGVFALGVTWNEFNHIQTGQADLSHRVALLEKSMVAIEIGIANSAEKQTAILAKQEMGNALIGELRVALAGKGIIITKGGN